MWLLALFPVWPLALFVPLLSRMRIICSPVGVTDPMAEKWIPKVPDFLPAKEVIIIAICLDGKRKVPGGQTKFDLLDCRRMLRKMSRRLSDNQVLDVRLEEVSFWDDAAEFTRKIVNCDWFVMCGFTGGERLIDEV